MSEDLKKISLDIRCDVLKSIGHLGVGHIGGCLSVVELLSVLYFEAMNIDPANPKKPGRDRFICSKGHAGPAVYAALANRGYFDRKELLTLNEGGTNLPSHCDMNRTVGIDMTTGSLGQAVDSVSAAQMHQQDGEQEDCACGKHIYAALRLLHNILNGILYGPYRRIPEMHRSYIQFDRDSRSEKQAGDRS